MIRPLSKESKAKEMELLTKIAEEIAKRTGIPEEYAIQAITEFKNIIQENGGVHEDEHWPYWDRRDTRAPDKCSMLQLCLDVEMHPGIILYLSLQRKYKL